MTITLTPAENKVTINGVVINLQMVMLIDEFMSPETENSQTLLKEYVTAISHIQDIATLNIQNYCDEELVELHNSLSLIAQFKLKLRGFFYE
jgi:hypothetical protein